MIDLKSVREKIDKLDETIMDKLNERFSIMEQVALCKQSQNLPIIDQDRENEIIQKTKDYHFKLSLARIYQQIFYESKLLQSLQTYLVGKSLPYTYSPDIHNFFQNNYYQVVEVNNFNDFIKEYPFYGANITTPFKKDAYECATTHSLIAKRTQVANLLIKKNGVLHAENVDYYGFIEMLMYYQISVEGKKVIIVGNGATSSTVETALTDLGAKEIVKLVRTVRAENDVPLNLYHQYQDFEIIINTTTYGVRPNYQLNFLFPLSDFTHLEAVIDVNYNPFRTPLMQEAYPLKQKNPDLKIVSGLYMLVEGARKSEEIWMGEGLHLPSTLQTVRHIHEEKINIVLIGMPYSGKTTTGYRLSKLFRRPFLDTDVLLEKNKEAITDFLNQPDFPANFRKAEKKIVQKAMDHEGHVIATGGGVVEDQENMQLLAQTGVIIYLNTSLSTLQKRYDGSRPLLASSEDFFTLYEKRHPLYLKYADIVVNNECDYLNEIMVKLHEYFLSQYIDKKNCENHF